MHFFDDVFGNFSVSGRSPLHASSTKRSGSLIRATSPKSPSASAFESVEGSDDEDDIPDDVKLDTTYLHTNGNAVSLLCTYKSTFYHIMETSIFPLSLSQLLDTMILHPTRVGLFSLLKETVTEKLKGCLCTSFVQGPECKTIYENLPDHIKVNGEQLPIATTSMIRSHSVSGDLHGVQPDPIAADILRKEPEQETFARLKITPTGINRL